MLSIIWEKPQQKMNVWKSNKKTVLSDLFKIKISLTFIEIDQTVKSIANRQKKIVTFNWYLKW